MMIQIKQTRDHLQRACGLGEQMLFSEVHSGLAGWLRG